MCPVMHRHHNSRTAGVTFGSIVYQEPEYTYPPESSEVLSSMEVAGSLDDIEESAASHIYVSRYGDNSSGGSWSEAFTSISKALYTAESRVSCVIHVEAGEWTVYVSESNAYIMGGYYRANGTMSRNPFTHPTMLFNSSGGLAWKGKLDGITFTGHNHLDLSGTTLINCVLDASTVRQRPTLNYASAGYTALNYGRFYYTFSSFGDKAVNCYVKNITCAKIGPLEHCVIDNCRCMYDVPVTTVSYDGGLSKICSEQLDNFELKHDAGGDYIELAYNEQYHYYPTIRIVDSTVYRNIMVSFSTSIEDSTVLDSVLVDCEVNRSSVYDSRILNSSVLDSSVYDAKAMDGYFGHSIIYDSSTLPQAKDVDFIGYPEMATGLASAYMLTTTDSVAEGSLDATDVVVALSDCMGNSKTDINIYALIPTVSLFDSVVFNSSIRYSDRHSLAEQDNKQTSSSNGMVWKCQYRAYNSTVTEGFSIGTYYYYGSTVSRDYKNKALYVNCDVDKGFDNSTYVRCSLPSDYLSGRYNIYFDCGVADYIDTARHSLSSSDPDFISFRELDDVVIRGRSATLDDKKDEVLYGVYELTTNGDAYYIIDGTKTGYIY